METSVSLQCQKGSIVIQATIDSIFLREERCFHHSDLCSASEFLCLTFSLSAPLPGTWFFRWCGGLDQINRNQGQTEEVKSRVSCILRAQESEPAEEGLRKVPDLYKDDLAQRRIQGRPGPHREAPRFITAARITEADLETWERLKVSERTRCVMVSPSSDIL